MFPIIPMVEEILTVFVRYIRDKREIRKRVNNMPSKISIVGKGYVKNGGDLLARLPTIIKILALAEESLLLV